MTVATGRRSDNIMARGQKSCSKRKYAADNATPTVDVRTALVCVFFLFSFPPFCFACGRRAYIDREPLAAADR